MTLRSRLSAAWRAFRQDDSPPTRVTLALLRGCDSCGAKFGIECHDDICPRNQGYGHINTNRDKILKTVPGSSYADACIALKAEQDAQIANVEAPTIIRKRRKLASVPKE